MTNETRDKIINDAIKMKLLITTCLGCGRPTYEEDAKAAGLKPCNDCPAGTGLSWNPRAVEAVSHSKEAHQPSQSED